jgi:hypothetical protein
MIRSPSANAALTRLGLPYLIASQSMEKELESLDMEPRVEVEALLQLDSLRTVSASDLQVRVGGRGDI